MASGGGSSFIIDLFLLIFIAFYIFYFFKFSKTLQEIYFEAKESYEGNSFMNFVVGLFKYLSFQSINIIIHTVFIVIITFLIITSIGLSFYW